MWENWVEATNNPGIDSNNALLSAVPAKQEQGEQNIFGLSPSPRWFYPKELSSQRNHDYSWGNLHTLLSLLLDGQGPVTQGSWDRVIFRNNISCSCTWAQVQPWRRLKGNDCESRNRSQNLFYHKQWIHSSQHLSLFLITRKSSYCSIHKLLL